MGFSDRTRSSMLVFVRASRIPGWEGRRGGGGGEELWHQGGGRCFGDRTRSSVVVFGRASGRGGGGGRRGGGGGEELWQGNAQSASALSLQAEKKPTSAKQSNNMSCVLPVRAACLPASIPPSKQTSSFGMCV